MMEWWDDDPELLGATLGMLAAWEGGGSTPVAPKSLAGGDESSTASSDGGESAPSRGRSVNVSRERRKQEVLALRKKAADMQRKLDELRRRREAMLRPHYRDPSKSQLVSVAPVWESIATRQFQARRKSEAQNLKLRGMLAAQARVAEELMRMIQRAQHESAFALPKQIALEASQRISKEEQIRFVDALRSQEPTFFASTKFWKGPLRFSEMDTIRCEGLEVEGYLWTSTAVPFSVSRVEAATWAMFEDDTSYDDTIGTYEQCHQSTSDTIYLAFTSTAKIGGSNGKICGKWLVKRFGGDGTQRLLVSHSFSEVEGFHNELDHALIIDEVQVRILDVHELGHKHLAQPLTAIQHSRRVRINFSENRDWPDPSRMKVLMRDYLQQTLQELLWADQMIENFLLGLGQLRIE